MGIYNKLNTIQTQINAPKKEYNSFGRYNYRTCESILQELKPLLKQTGTCVTLTDEPILIGDRVYIKATAELADTEDGATVSTTAYARESDTKKGMDSAQVTGAASSYARKYALCGLFAIDGSDDPDKLNINEDYTKDTGRSQSVSDGEKTKLLDEAALKGFTKEQIIKACKQDYHTDLDHIGIEQFKQLKQRITKAQVRA